MVMGIYCVFFLHGHWCIYISDYMTQFTADGLPRIHSICFDKEVWGISFDSTLFFSFQVIVEASIGCLDDFVWFYCTFFSPN